jgi:hypothetical protein
VDGSEEWLDAILDRFDEPGAARPTTERIRAIWRVCKQHLRDASDIGGPYECEQCGERFMTPRNYTTARYCSGKCREKAYRQRRAAERDAELTETKETT